MKLTGQINNANIEELLQKAQLAGKLIELSMNAQ